MPKKLDQLRKGKEFLNYAEKHGATVRQGKGSHNIRSSNSSQMTSKLGVNDRTQAAVVGLKHRLVKDVSPVFQLIRKSLPGFRTDTRVLLSGALGALLIVASCSTGSTPTVPTVINTLSATNP